MKKTHKKILGFLGILAVVAITAFAAMLPVPPTQATSSVTDTIVVKVTNGAPDVNILGIPNGEIIYTPDQSFTVQHSNVDLVTVKLEHTDLAGTVTNYDLDSFEAGYAEGSKNYNISTSTYGYGKYVVNVHGEGAEGAWDADAVTFYYYPAYAELVKQDDKYYVDVYYNPDNGAVDPTTTGEVASIVVRIYDANGHEVSAISPITINPVDPSGYSRVELKFEENNLDYGDYNIYVYSYNRDGVQLSDPYVFTVNFSEQGIIVPNTADTGGMFQGTNISQTDYLITGLIVFGVIAVAGVVFILQHDKRQAATRRPANRRSINRKSTTRRRR